MHYDSRQTDGPESRVIMFDYDGVIADSLEVFFVEFAGACRDLGYHKLTSKEELLKLFEGNALAQLVKAGFPVWKLKKLYKQLEPRIAAVNDRVQPFPGMPELLGRLASRHVVYVITSNHSSTVERFLVRHGIETVRDVLGAEKEASKVKKIKGVIQQYPGHQAYYVGDTKGDMLEARAAGAIAVAAAWGWHGEAKLREGCPEHVLHSPEELADFFGAAPGDAHAAATQ